MRIIVPATSANIGPGFDSIGVALSKYLIIEVLEESTEWLVEHNLVNIPKIILTSLFKQLCMLSRIWHHTA